MILHMKDHSEESQPAFKKRKTGEGGTQDLFLMPERKSSNHQQAISQAGVLPSSFPFSGISGSEAFQSLLRQPNFAENNSAPPVPQQNAVLQHVPTDALQLLLLQHQIQQQQQQAAILMQLQGLGSLGSLLGGNVLQGLPLGQNPFLLAPQLSPSLALSNFASELPGQGGMASTASEQAQSSPKHGAKQHAKKQSPLPKASRTAYAQEPVPTIEEQMKYLKDIDIETLELPAPLARLEDDEKLSKYQVFLRNQIEIFKATEEDIKTHTRGRNKPIMTNQLGIRCRHCAHIPTSQRQKGSTYFPAALKGLYQAAQNMSTTHMQSGVCCSMSDDVKARFVDSVNGKYLSSGAGRPYWAESARKLGVVDTANGMRFIKDVKAKTEEIS